MDISPWFALPGWLVLPDSGHATGHWGTIRKVCEVPSGSGMGAELQWSRSAVAEQTGNPVLIHRYRGPIYALVEDSIRAILGNLPLREPHMSIVRIPNRSRLVCVRSEPGYLHQCGRNPLMLRLLTPVLRSTKVVIIAEEPGRVGY